MDPIKKFISQCFLINCRIQQKLFFALLFSSKAVSTQERVVYFDQQTGAAQPIWWMKYAFGQFLLFRASFFVKKRRRPLLHRLVYTGIPAEEGAGLEEVPV